MEVKEENEPPKPIQTQETFDSAAEEDEDRISLLPDCLIIDEILSRLDSTKDAIRTGTLSKRWQHLWPSVPILYFNGCFMKKPPDHSVFMDKPRPDFYPAVDKTLTQCRHRQLKNLYKFSVDAAYDNRFESHVDNWIHFATTSNVQHLHLYLRVDHGCEEDRFVLEDDSFFINSHFTHLRLGYCILNPSGPITWNNLTTLSFLYVKLDQDLIANILSGSPLLDTLNLVECCMDTLDTLDITSKSVKNLMFNGYYPQDNHSNLDDIIEINAPYISSLVIEDHLMLWKILLRDVSSLVKVELDYKMFGHVETTTKKDREEMLKTFILRLRHVKELKIGIRCYPAFSRLEAKGFIFPSNLKVAEVTYPHYDTDYGTDDSELGDCSDNDSSVGDSSGSVLVTQLKA